MYCPKCGKEIDDNDNFCPFCGGEVSKKEVETAKIEKKNTSEGNALKLVAKIFMLIKTILVGFVFLIPLAWCIPMTVVYWKSVNEKKPVSVGFKVCTLLFVSLVAGILMLCDSEDK